MSITNLRYFILATLFASLIASSVTLGWFWGFLSVFVPVMWLCFFSLWRSGFALSSYRAEPGLVASIVPIALCFAAAWLIAPIFVAIGESLNNFFGAVSQGSTLVYFTLRAGLIEELLKLTAVLGVIQYLSPGAIKHPTDGIVLACSAALGFSAYENIFHNLYLAELQTGTLKAFMLGALIRVPLHALYGSIWGAALGVSRFLAPPGSYLVLVFGLVPSIFIHGLWDTLAQSQSNISVLLLTLLYVALWYFCCRMWKQVKEAKLA